MSETKKDDIPSIERRFEDDFITISYPNGKVVKSFIDGRKKDVVIKEPNDDWYFYLDCFYIFGLERSCYIFTLYS